MSVGSGPKSRKVAICVKKLAPCNNICPAGEDIRRWLSLVKENKFRQAWEVIRQSNPFPAIHGRVCYHYCETRCNRTQYDEKVGIHCVERFLGDMAVAEEWTAPVAKEKTGKKVLVVGAGPAGLSAAYYLRLLGHDVTIYEALSKPGGMMFAGIPAYRLPRDILAREIKCVLDVGIDIEYDRKVDDILAEKEKGGFDAVFLGIGAHLAKNVAVPMEDPCQVLEAIDYLREAAFDKAPDLGGRLVIYGGGNTAVDVARTAKRLGVSDVSIVYHRSRERMSAFACEIEDASEEGVKFRILRSITGIKGSTLTLSINELDEKGRPKHTGETETMEADTLVFALSQIPDSDFLRKVSDIDVQPNGVVTVDESYMTGFRGVFAGGDVIPYERSITVAVGQGRRAANHIDAYLNETVSSELPKRERIPFERLRVDDEKSKMVEQKFLDPAIRIESFDEVALEVKRDDVLCEAKRCFSCGSCFGCGKCYAVCPVNAIMHSKLDGRVTCIAPEVCIGCAKCFKACPSGAISMVDR